ncbi:Similar to RETREG2: Reticulophagy regulator 2 (Homo sapiens) [Cotesia congregata]|uniref:Similar to RETREG2: Reticulophagy regulator 2 (Homo sapiens) n=1 Tax=Cotesia congregata TaxID=51543 RepID=A0A8J2MSY0_COTCN|nr:Similar to RETREG2: Reticulophagy regulator 2 (Homo sapiens) [Cotesia congregata]
MEKLLKTVGSCFKWIKQLPEVKNFMGDEKSLDSPDNHQQCRKKNSTCHDLETSKKIFTIIESILLWENTFNSIAVVAVFNILFWGIVVLEIRGFAAASSAALVVVLSYSTLEAQVEKDQLNKSLSNSTIPTQQRAECIEKIIIKIKSGFEMLMLLRKNQPGGFCIGVCTASIILWLISGAVNGVVMFYIICMSILLGPALFVKIPKKMFTPKEWESEIDEFLPVVTEDNLQLLNRAGETGDHSPTPPSGSSSDNPIDPFNDNELVGLKMPSHEDGSTDGLELSELELSAGETDVDGLKIQSRHFEKGSSSEDDEELELKSKDLSSDSDEGSDESEFEVIDSHEINNTGNV